MKQHSAEPFPAGDVTANAIVAPVLAGARPTFRAVASTVVPDAETLDEDGWREVETIVETALSARPEKVRRQLATLLRVIRWLPVAKWGRRFEALDRPRRTALLTGLERSRLILLRRGFWGLRTLVLMGYYGRRSAAAEIGYRATRAGWDAAGRSDHDGTGQVQAGGS